MRIRFYLMVLALALAGCATGNHTSNPDGTYYGSTPYYQVIDGVQYGIDNKGGRWVLVRPVYPAGQMGGGAMSQPEEWRNILTGERAMRTRASFEDRNIPFEPLPY